MNGPFGIDHPLLATHDIAALRDHLITLGFNMTAVGRHPWGTSTSLAMFDGCLLEIMGVYDATLIDEVPAGDFRFGRHVFEHLEQREGVALTALHSTGSHLDAQRAAEAGFTVAGHLEFGRDVTLPDGTAGRTRTTLALLPDHAFPRLSLFLCQQHRPDLIYVPQWLQHPNRVTGICGVTIVAQRDHHKALKSRFGGLYDGLHGVDGGFQYQTANGVLRVLEPTAFVRTIGPLPKALRSETLPFVAGMDFTMTDPDALGRYLAVSRVKFVQTASGFVLKEPERTANTVFRFCTGPDCT